MTRGLGAVSVVRKFQKSPPDVKSIQIAIPRLIKLGINFSKLTDVLFGAAFLTEKAACETSTTDRSGAMITPQYTQIP